MFHTTHILTSIFLILFLGGAHGILLADCSLEVFLLLVLGLNEHELGLKLDDLDRVMSHFLQVKHILK